LTLNQNLMKEYEMAWKQIEYNMKTNWQFLLGLGASTGSIFLIVELLEILLPKFPYVWFGIGTVIIVLVVWLLFLERNIAIADVYRRRMLEIEAYLGLRAVWREYLSTDGLRQDMSKWARRGFEVDVERARTEIGITAYDHCPTLMRIVGQKYADAETMWQLRIPHGKTLVWIGFLAPLIWFAVLLAYWIMNL